MFTQLSALLSNCASVSLILAANKDGTLTVTVLPKPKATGEDAAALGTPLSLKATPQELDDGFIAILNEFVNKHETLAEQLANTAAILDAAKTESQKKATTTISKSAKAAPSKPDTTSSNDDSDDENIGGGDGEEDTLDSDNTAATGSSTEQATTQPVSLWG